MCRPCEFRHPPIMTVHAALLAQRIQALANDGPHIITVSIHCPLRLGIYLPGSSSIHRHLISLVSTPHTQGDFNFQPSWPQYQLLTEGSIPSEHPHYPPMPAHDPWVPKVDQPLRSAVATKWGKEPDFTCYSYKDRVS